MNAGDGFYFGDLPLHRLWAGGQGAIENGYLLRSRNGTVWDRWDDLVDNPTVVKEIAFSAADNDKVFVGWEGALLTTPDGGASWETLIESEENRFYFGIGVSNQSASRATPCPVHEQRRRTHMERV